MRREGFLHIPGFEDQWIQRVRGRAGSSPDIEREGGPLPGNQNAEGGRVIESLSRYHFSHSEISGL